MGEYRCVDLSKDAADIATHAKKTGRNDITMVLRLEPVSRYTARTAERHVAKLSSSGNTIAVINEVVTCIRCGNDRRLRD